MVPAPEKQPIRVAILLRDEIGVCHRTLADLDPGSTWRRVTVRVPAVDGRAHTYSVGALRLAAAAEPEKPGPCTPAEKRAKFLRRSLSVAAMQAPARE